MRRAVLALLFLVIIAFCVSCESVSAQKLATPQLVAEGNKIEWETVANASQYEIVTEDKTIITSNTVFYFENYDGEIKVRSLGDGKTYADSDWASVTV